MKKFLLLCFSFVFVLSAWAQDRVVSGRVTSAEDGTSLPGVNVVLKGTTNGTVTDADGNYKLTVPATGGSLGWVRYWGSRYFWFSGSLKLPIPP